MRRMLIVAAMLPRLTGARLPRPACWRSLRHAGIACARSSTVIH